MAIRTGSVTYTSPSRLKNLAITVTGADRPETMSRSHASSTRWMWASMPWSATTANTTAVSASTAAVTAASRPGRPGCASSGRLAAASRLSRDMPHPARTAPGPRCS